MLRLSKAIPKYRKHRASGQAIVTLDGRDFYLGPHGTSASRKEYDRLVGEWQVNGRHLPRANEGTDADLDITELIAAYWKHVVGYYRKNGEPTSEQRSIAAALRWIKRLYGNALPSDFSPLKLKAVRESLIEAGHPNISRSRWSGFAVFPTRRHRNRSGRARNR